MSPNAGFVTVRGLGRRLTRQLGTAAGFGRFVYRRTDPSRPAPEVQRASVRVTGGVKPVGRPPSWWRRMPSDLGVSSGADRNRTDDICLANASEHDTGHSLHRTAPPQVTPNAPPRVPFLNEWGEGRGDPGMGSQP